MDLNKNLVLEYLDLQAGTPDQIPAGRISHGAAYRGFI
jgi:hypothetical protein